MVTLEACLTPIRTYRSWYKTETKGGLLCLLILGVAFLCWPNFETVISEMKMKNNRKLPDSTSKTHSQGEQNHPIGYLGVGCEQFLRTLDIGEDTNRTSRNVVISTKHYGRLGNRIASVGKMVATAQRECCDISIPSDLLSGWSPSSTKFANSDKLCSYSDGGNITTTKKCPAKAGKDWFYDQVSFSNTTGQCSVNILRSYFGINGTHVLDRACRPEPYLVLHVRSGDVTRGSYNISNGNFVSGDVHQGYWIFPTSYYVAVIQSIFNRLGKPPRIFALCESMSNPSCIFLQKLSVIYNGTFTLRIGQPLLDDLVILLCAAEVATSNGTFKRVLDLSHRLQVKHDFSLTPKATCIGTNLKLYWIKNEGERNTFSNHVRPWLNSGYQRYLSDTFYEMGMTLCK